MSGPNSCSVVWELNWLPGIEVGGNTNAVRLTAVVLSASITRQINNSDRRMNFLASIL